MGFLDKFRAPQPTHDLGRNDPCWCGSGLKYKRCHLEKDQKKVASQTAKKCSTTS
jgi:uncharacterized protein YecA (UPF0149 family)